MARWGETDVTLPISPPAETTGWPTATPDAEPAIDLDGLLEVGAADVYDLGGHARDVTQVAQVFLGQHLL